MTRKHTESAAAHTPMKSPALEPDDASSSSTPPPPSASAAAAIAAFCNESVPPKDIQQLTMLQAQIHHHLKTANGEIAAFNTFSAEEHARLVHRFTKHAATLQTVHASLLTTFKRTRALRSRLLAAHPELAEAAAAADAARDAEIERGRNEAATTMPAASMAPPPAAARGVASADAEIAPAPKSAAEPPAEPSAEPSAEPPAEPTLASDDELLPHMERLRVGESPTLLTAPADAPT